MAPVGSRESLAAAIQAGADSIYFGIENLNMRARSANTFTVDDLREIAQTCDEHGMKSYLTVNTIIYDKDIPLMRTIVDAAKAAGISAVIAADVAVMNYARQIGQEVHLSTQLNISNAEALKFYAQFADVVVLARELNLEQVAEIYRQIREENICGPSGEQIRIEMFCHGALCMAVSGKCYLSLHEMNHSANRGACMQVCRRSYTVRDKETDVELDIDNEYIMSPKDLKTIHFMNKMMDAGVRVFKIEGRARGPEYVRTVVECYKEAIKAYLDDTFTDEKIAAWDERLKAVFNRGFWDGYYLGQRLGEWTRNYGSAATERKIYVGKGIKYFSNIGVSEFLVEAAEVSVGDKLLITGPTTGAVFMTLDEARVDLKPVETVKKGQRFSMKSEKIRPSDKLYKLVSTEELKKFKGLDVEQKRGYTMSQYIYELEMKVRDYECDLQGIVNNANYQHYLEHTRHEFLTSVGVSFAALHEQGVDPVVARINMAFKTPLKSGDEFVSKLYMKKEGIKYVFYQDIFRKSDQKVVVKSTVETVCVVNGRLSNSELFDNVFAPYLK